MLGKCKYLFFQTSFFLSTSTCLHDISEKNYTHKITQTAFLHVRFLERILFALFNLFQNINSASGSSVVLYKADVVLL